MNKHVFGKKTLSLVLCVMMVVSILPVNALAEEAAAENLLSSEIMLPLILEELPEEELTAEESPVIEGSHATQNDLDESAIAEVPSVESMTPDKVTSNAKKLISGSRICMNTLYEDLLQDQVVLDAAGADLSLLPDSTTEYFSDMEEAAVYLRSNMVSRTAAVQFSLVVDLSEAETQEDIDNILFGLLDDIVYAALSHTGVATEGDYLSGQLGGWSGNYSGIQIDTSTSFSITYIVEPIYFTTAAQEEAITAKVNEIIQSMAFDSTSSDYQKVKEIYDYICNSVTYDYSHYQEEINGGYCTDYIPHSTYGALINSTAVCQGYSALFYRLALEVGLDARTITGVSSGDRHSWNIVKLGDYYYNVDTTWGSSQSSYTYFLRSNSNFADHSRDEKYDTELFYAAYPMSEVDYELESEIVWIYNEETGVLTVGGVGPVDSNPWSYLNSSAVEVVVEEGVTRLCSSAFENFYNMTKLTLPDSLTEIGAWCFNNCVQLLELELPSGITTLTSYSFANCDSLKSIVIPDSVQTIEFDTFAWCDALESVTIGKNAENLINNPFNECPNLKTISVSSENTGLKVVDGSLIGIVEENMALAGGEYLICGPMASTGSYTIPEGVVYLCANSFGGSQLSELIIPEGVLSFDNPIHRMPNIQTLTLPASMFYFDANMFECDKLHSIWVAEGSEYFSSRDGLLYDAAGETLLAYPQGRRDKVIIIPEGTKKIGVCNDYTSNFLFYLDSVVETIILPQGLETLGSGVFFEANSLKNIYVPSSISWIYMGAFSLPPFAAGNELTVVLDAAEGYAYEHFNTYAELYSVYYDTPISIAIKSNVPLITFDVNGASGQTDSITYSWGEEFGELPEPEWEDHYFLGWYTTADGGNQINSSDVVLASQTLYAHWAEFTLTGSCGDNLTWTLYGDNILVLEGYGAMDDYNIYAFDMPWANYRFTIDTVILPDGLTHIGSKAFFCIGMSEIVIPDSVTSIGAAAFNGCDKLESIVIPEGVTRLEKQTFQNAFALKSIYLPSTLTDISSDYCFYCFDGDARYKGNIVEEIYYYGTDTQWESMVPDILKDVTTHFIVRTAAIEATCTTNGLTPGEYCSECGKVLVSPDTVMAFGHNEVVDEAVTPTFTDVGLTEGSHCSVCGEVLVKQSVIPMLLMGDVDMDGDVDAIGAQLALNHAMGLGVLTDNRFTAADVNRDGTIDARDATQILRYVNELSSVLDKRE